MTFLNLTIAIIVAVLLIITFYLKLIRPYSTTESERITGLPMTPLQVRAWFGLGIGVAVSAAVVVLVSRLGPTQLFDNSSTRYLFYGLLGGGGMLWALVWFLTRPKTGVPLDERDRAILVQAPSIQSGLIIISLAAWMIGLTEAYRTEGSIPVIYATLIFWSSWIVHMLGLSIGVLFGYWKARTHVEA